MGVDRKTASDMGSSGLQDAGGVWAGFVHRAKRGYHRGNRGDLLDAIEPKYCRCLANLTHSYVIGPHIIGAAFDGDSGNINRQADVDTGYDRNYRGIAGRAG
ncbi:MAG: hypothetical protein AAFU58_06985, partial [Pseudomonadota bacterium]